MHIPLGRLCLAACMLAGPSAFETPAAGQNSEPASRVKSQRLEFEVASIRTNGDQTARPGVQISGSQVTMNAALPSLIIRAYHARFSSFPHSIPDTAVTIRAKIPDGASAYMIPEMLRSLLEERFKLSVHWDKQVKKVYSLKLDGISRLTGSVGLDPSLPGFDSGFVNSGPRSLSAPNGGVIRQSPTADGGSKIDSTGGSLVYFVEILSKYMDRPVIDSTGLRGYFDFKMSFSAEDIERTINPGAGANRTPPPANPTAARTPSLRDSLKALGLKLEKNDEPVEVLVIDHVDSVPTDN
jgi:uncharacterized protein (TIGR03435 family)